MLGSRAGRGLTGGIVLAAGAGTRFGGLKQLVELEGRPLLEHAVEAMLAVPVLDRIVVVLGAEAEVVSASADLAGTVQVVAPDWEEGISASLRAGVAALADADAAVVTLADQPRVRPEVIRAVLAQLEGPALAARATYHGVPGHPVAVKRELFAEVARLRGDHGARDLLAKRGVVSVECGHLSGGEDVDTPADLESLRRSQQ